MENYRLMWTQAGRDGRQSSSVSYGKTAAETYKGYKQAEDGVSDVQVVPVKPGE